jgi:uncharacterized protein (DUF302 family)
MPVPPPPEGLIIHSGSHGSAETADRLVAALTKRGITILARIDHAAAAAKAGMSLRPTEVLIFGNPRAGTPLMQAAQSIGIDLPLKALVFEDSESRTWIAYNDPEWLAARHHVGGAKQTLENMRSALAAIVQEAA